MKITKAIQRLIDQHYPMRPHFWWTIEHGYYRLHAVTGYCENGRHHARRVWGTWYRAKAYAMNRLIEKADAPIASVRIAEARAEAWIDYNPQEPTE